MLRVRFAPSPTGFLHIGGLRTALYNFLFARKKKGKFVLRIEDTDRQRLVEGATENLIKTLDAVGLKYDEGPYIQSQKLLTYQNLAQKLVDADKAYYCFCTSEELDKMRQEQIANKLPPRYDGRCRKLTEKQIIERVRNNIPYVIRLKVPRAEEGSVKFKDLVRGEVEFNLKDIDDQILLKSDGWPTYHLANVTDDHLMKITHVIRGEEWLPSTPKHILIYQAFGWPVPQFAHLPLLLNPDKSKLSKRQGDVAVEEFLARGYLPEALFNFIALLGWNPGSEKEIFSLKELIKEFSLERVQKAGAVFNRERLDWMNGYYIRQMKSDELAKKCVPYLEQAGLIDKKVNFDWLKKVIALEQERMKKLSDIVEMAGFFFTKNLDYNPKLLFWKKMSKEEVIKNLKLAQDKLNKFSVQEFKKEKIEKSLMELAKKTGTGELFWPLRVALTGCKGSPPPTDIAELLGKDKVINRIGEGIERIK